MLERRAVFCFIVALVTATVMGLGSILVSAMLSPVPQKPFYTSGGAEAPAGLSLRIASPGKLIAQLNAADEESTLPLATIAQVVTRKSSPNSTATIETLRDGRNMITLRYWEPERNYQHWAAYELTTGTPTTAKMLLHHTAARTLRQRSDLEMHNSIWSQAPVFYGNGFFWTGPRLLVLDGDMYRPTTNVLQYAIAALRKSPLMWFALLCTYVSGLAVAAGIFRSAVREITQNLSIILWVLIMLRVLLALFYGDVAYTVAWLSPVITCASFVTAIYLFHLQHFRADSPRIDERLKRRRKIREIT